MYEYMLEITMNRQAVIVVAAIMVAVYVAT